MQSAAGDGRWVLVTMLEAGRPSGDVWMLPTATADAPRALLTGSFVERDARFSHDGHLIAYVSYESGGPEIYVRTSGSVSASLSLRTEDSFCGVGAEDPERIHAKGCANWKN